MAPSSSRTVSCNFVIFAILTADLLPFRHLSQTKTGCCRCPISEVLTLAQVDDKLARLTPRNQWGTEAVPGRKATCRE